MSIPKESGLAQASIAGKTSSIFAKESLYELDSLRKKEAGASTSVIALAQQPDEKPSKAKPKLSYENTYILEPKRKFRAGDAQIIIDQVLVKHLKDEKYDPNACKQLAKTLAEIIKSSVKELNYERYKIICIVTIGQLDEQGLRCASRCVWDTNWDTFASGSYQNKSLYGVATVYAVYYE